MTPEERLAILETKVEGQEKWLQSIDEKVDQLLAAANMGKGAWWLLLKLGGFVVILGGFIAWVVDHILKALGKA